MSNTGEIVDADQGRPLAGSTPLRWSEHHLPAAPKSRWRGPRHVVLARWKGQAVGLGLLTLGQPGVGRVGVIVEPPFRRQGIGRRLMERLLDLADRRLELSRLELEVSANNTVATHLYESLGFVHEGAGPVAADVLLMSRRRGA